jgi:imidazolonepropionase-like amidohydrolase
MALDTVKHLRVGTAYTGVAGQQAIRDAVVAVQGGRIAWVRPYTEVADNLQHDQSVGHYPNSTAVPGLVDAHSHITLAGDSRTYEELALDPDEMMALTAVSNMRRHLESGVTTLRDNGGRNRVSFVVREAIRRGYISGPRLLLSGRPVTHSAGHFHWCNGVADGVEAIRALVRQLVAEGADHIKIMASGGDTAGIKSYYASYDVEELRTAVDTAHGLGRLTTAHCRAATSIENAVHAGLDCIEHAEFLVPGEIVEYGGGIASSGGVIQYDGRTVGRILEEGTFVSFTMQAGGYDALLALRSRSETGRLSSEEMGRLALLEAYFEMKLGLFAQLLSDGMLGRMAISTDAGPFDASFGHLDYGMELAVQAGMRPVDVIDATTRVAAEACGVAAEVGTLEAGKQADILCVDGDPTQDITAMRNVRAVYQAGQLVAPLVASSPSFR